MNSGNVYKLKIPYGNQASKLRTNRHMYIVRNMVDTYVELVKVNKLKFPIRCSAYIIVLPNLEENPFVRKTVIDCGQYFTTYNILYPNLLLTKRRQDISKVLLEDIRKKTAGAKKWKLNKQEMLRLNPDLMDYDDF